MSPADFVHLHVHSCYSLLRGGGGLQTLLDHVQALGMSAVALTDTNGMYGAVPFYTAARAMGVHPVLGVEILAPPGQRVVALARNREGYSNLCRLTTARQLDPHFDLLEMCTRYQEQVYFLTADCPLLSGLAAQVPTWRLFAELVPRPGRPQRERIHDLVRTARALGIGYVATNDVYFIRPEDHAVHRTLRAIDCLVAQEQLDAEAHEVASPEAWLRSADEMRDACAALPDAIANTLRIAEDCRVELPMGKPQFPHAPVPANMTPYRHLRAECEAGVRQRYGPRPAPEVTARLDYELEVIDRLGFSPYFLIVSDIVRFARERGIPCVGRGSAADSLVAYALGIGAVDPIHYDLYFERFLHLGRTDCPDIDIDFCWRRRDAVLQYVYDTYGAERVAMISSHVTFGARSAFRDVAKTFGLPLEEINRISSRLPHADVANIRAALARFPECRGLPFDAEPYRSVLALAERIDGFPRHVGMHPCGLVIAPTPLTDLVPLEMATKGLVVTQYDMHPIEALGLVKMDLLGQRALSIVTDAATTIRDTYKHPIDLQTLPEPDPAVSEMARTGDTLGCFQIDSPGMRNLLQQIQATTRLDLIKALSLIRPGPAASGMKESYVRRARGLECTPKQHPILEALLADTYGVMLYQEDLLRIAHKLAGFSRADADALRKAMSKKRSPARMAELRQRFLDGCAAQGVPVAVAQDVWTRMRNFAGYSYCKAHACTYGHISYQGLWLKAHYPTAFFAAVLNNAAGMYAARTYLEDARRHGVVVRPVDLHASEYWSTVEEGYSTEEGPQGAEIREPPVALRIGLWHVAGLSRTTIDAILAVRPFRNLRDFCRRVPAERDEVESLILCGAFDGFGLTRPQLLWDVAQVFDAIQRSKVAEQPLFPGAVFLDHVPPIPDLPDYDAEQRLEMEQRVLGLDLSAHPLDAFADALAEYELVSARVLPAHAGRRVRVAGWLVASRRVVTKHQDYMRFVTLEDATGLIELVLFPETYQAYGHLVRGYGPYIATGTIDDAYGACTMTVDHLAVLEPGDSHDAHARLSP